MFSEIMTSQKNTMATQGAIQYVKNVLKFTDRQVNKTLFLTVIFRQMISRVMTYNCYTNLGVAFYYNSVIFEQVDIFFRRIVYLMEGLTFI